MDTASSEDNFLPPQSSSDDVDSPPTLKQKKRARSRTATSTAHSSTTRSTSRIVPDFTRPLKRRRAEGDCPAEYQTLLAGASDGSDKLDAESRYSQYETTYVGISKWTGVEKNLFFEAISVHGRDNTQAIADQIQTKSQLEVERYIQLLERESSRVEHAAGYQDSDGYELGFGAVDISSYLNVFLDMNAEKLAVQELDTEEEAERARFGMAWLLDESLVNAITYSNFRIDKLLQPMGAESEEVLQSLEFFDLPMFLRLSTSYFMNSGDPEWHYVTHASAGELPSIRLSALAELYSLVTAFTERLVSTTLHCALSRLKAMAEYSRHSGKTSFVREVQTRDVHAAVRILKLTHPRIKHNLNAYWRDFCTKLDSEATAQLANLDQIRAGGPERELESITRWRSESARRGSLASKGSGSEPAPKSDSEEQDAESEVADAEDEEDSTTLHEDRVQLKVEEQMEKLDAYAARLEEARLASAIGVEAPRTDRIVPPSSTVPQRVVEDLPLRLDWRSEFMFQATWEQFLESASKQLFGERSESESEGLDMDSPGAPPVISIDDEDDSSSDIGSEGMHITDSKQPAVATGSLTYPPKVDPDVLASVELDEELQTQTHLEDRGAGIAPFQPPEVVEEFDVKFEQRSSSSEWSSHDPDSPTHQAFLAGQSDMK